MIRNASPKPSAVDRIAAKKAAKRDADRQRSKIYRQVERRDNYRCRACGDPVKVGSVHELDRAHHHHIRFRSQGGDDSTPNVVLLCPLCHAAIHERAGTKRLHLSGDADETVVCQQGDRTWMSTA